jgi:hypothetical protein
VTIGQFDTVFGSLERYIKGEIELINDDPKNYAFSNVFEVAARSDPYEKVVVGKNFEYVIETLRAEGASSWFAAPHDEFALVMDGAVEIHLVKLDDPPSILADTRSGSIRLARRPPGRAMGRMRLRRGHQALLPEGAAYRFEASGELGVIVLQTLAGPESVEKWSEICYT